MRVNTGRHRKVANMPNLTLSPNRSPAVKSFGVVIPNRYPYLAEQFIASIRETHEVMPEVVVVRDRHDATFGDDVRVIDGIEPFIYARNVNLGIQYFADRDVFVCNDDLTCVERNFFRSLYLIARAYPKCGIISPLVMGGIGNDIQNYHRKDELWKDKGNEIAVCDTLHFSCVLVMRRMIHRIGLLDENFAGYGFEDLDYCIRAIRGGFDTIVTQQLRIQHGDGSDGLERGRNYSLSFVRENLNSLSVDYFNRKYGTDFVMHDQRYSAVSK